MSKARVSATQVKELITTTIEDSIIMASMIDTANLLVDTHLLDVGHSAAVLAKIELYLAAHFVAITEERGILKRTKLGDSEDEWETAKQEPGLAGTRFGQTALTLDTSGVLAGVGVTKLKAEFRVV